MLDLSTVSSYVQERFAPRGTARVDAGTSLVESGWLSGIGPGRMPAPSSSS
jgi:hypothetical protein